MTRSCSSAAAASTERLSPRRRRPRREASSSTNNSCADWRHRDHAEIQQQQSTTARILFHSPPSNLVLLIWMVVMLPSACLLLENVEAFQADFYASSLASRQCSLSSPSSASAAKFRTAASFFPSPSQSQSPLPFLLLATSRRNNNDAAEQDDDDEAKLQNLSSLFPELNKASDDDDNKGGDDDDAKAKSSPRSLSKEEAALRKILLGGTGTLDDDDSAAAGDSPVSKRGFARTPSTSRKNRRKSYEKSNKNRNDGDDNKTTVSATTSKRQQRKDKQQSRKVKSAAPITNISEDDKDSPLPPIASLLPPPTQSTATTATSSSSSSSSFQDFINMDSSKTGGGAANDNPPNSRKRRNEESDASSQQKKLPSIADLFPPDLSARDENNSNDKDTDASTSKRHRKKKSTPTMDGVLPVSDLFYRSSQSMNNDEEGDDSKYQSSSRRGGDDEELPFSAEQSDKLESNHNRIQIRRNKKTGNKKRSAQQRQSNASGGRSGSSSSKRQNNNNSRKRRVVRRGIEMLVGGVPINADPPLRCVELYYKYKEDQNSNWTDTLTINTPDFGPMLYNHSVNTLSEKEKGLYCEYFVNNTLKWNVCPKDLRSIARQFVNQQNDGSAGISIFDFDDDDYGNLAAQFMKNMEGMTEIFDSFIADDSSQAMGTMKKIQDNDDNSDLMGELVFSLGVSKDELESCDTSKPAKTVLERVLEQGILKCTEYTGFNVFFNKLKLSDLGDGTTKIIADFNITFLDEEAASDAVILRKKCQRINSALAQAMDDGDMQFAMAAAARKEMSWPEDLRDRITEEFLIDEDNDSNDVDTGDLELKDAASFFADMDKNDLNEMNLQIKSTVESLMGEGTMKDFDLKGVPLFYVNMDDKEVKSIAASLTGDTGLKILNVQAGDASTVDSLLPEEPLKMKGFGDSFDDGLLTANRGLYLPENGENDGVFWNYAENNAQNAPYKGQLGLRLVDSVVEKAKQRHPRVIAIGDVHGCIDELQDLLRECDYRPGDLVVFLGDLVCKGPDSVSVVQMAREINALSCRGNHDFECLRWGQAIKAGVDPPIAVSEHFHIANSLTKADMKWMYNLPWYISSPDLGALFVHAGFVSGIRLAKQNPRLMMNMRSILPDGTVTSKFFNNWPWARLWDGPQTVLFGHDADRGLQQYEHAIGLDTGCVYGGRLTACILPEKRLVSVSARKSYFQYRRKHFD